MSLTSPKQNKTEKQTNKQKERWRGHRNSRAWPMTAGPDTNKKKKKKNLKNTAIQEKLELHTTIYWTRQGTSTITFLTDRIERTWIFTIIGKN